MFPRSSLALGIWSLLLSRTVAAPQSVEDAPDLESIEIEPESRRPSCHTPSNRACWSKDFDIHTDYEKKTPRTGVTRRYDLTVTEVDNYVGPDGVIKVKAMLINGQFPGPTLYANLGHTMEVTLHNKVRTNGTGIHWHGIRMYKNNINDGVPGVTECPLPPGQKKTYTFQVTQYGTSWYHTHVSSQYAYGVTGQLVFNGPAILPYDIDLGPFPITDWYYPGVDDMVHRLLTTDNPIVPGRPGGAPPSDNVLLNGTNINPKGPGGKYAVVKLTPGKTHRLRLINPSVDNTFTVSIVGHNMTVIQADFVPIKPYVTASLFMAIGQRYDVLINAPKDKIGNYWINVTYSDAGACGSSLNPNIAGILRYDGAPDSLPTDTGTKPFDTLCAESYDFSPIVQKDVPIDLFKPGPANNLDVRFNTSTTSTAVWWAINDRPINVTWAKPTLERVAEGNLTFPPEANIIRIAKTSKWSFWVIQNFSRLPHPMHLHGHDFYVLGSSPPCERPLPVGANPMRPFNPGTDVAKLHTKNPVRRDSTMLPALGWLVLAFPNDNPGSWLLHCHISWHVSQGLGNQFLEREEEIRRVMDLSKIKDTCDQ